MYRSWPQRFTVPYSYLLLGKFVCVYVLELLYCIAREIIDFSNAILFDH